jgi:cell division septation protein DedD
MSVGLSGKLALIAITVTAMAGGFGLGYVVGRNVPAPPVQLAAQVVLSNPPGPDVRVAKEEVKPQDSPSPSPAQAPVRDDSTASRRATPPEGQKTATPPAAEPGKAAVAANMSDDPKVQSGPVYTVQVGAFKNRKDADALTANLEGKGLKARRQKVGKKDKALYKVTVGEFSEKKEAEVLALKLKKTEGLKTFVTPKN